MLRTLLISWSVAKFPCIVYPGITYDISNKHRLGYSEVELVQCMIDGVNTLVQEDIALQKKHGISK